MAPAEGARALGTPPGPSCDEGLVKDDGTAETGWGWVPTAIRGEYVQQLNSGELPTRYIQKVCLCFLRTMADDDLDFDLVFYKPNTDGLPDSISPFAAVPGQVRDLPLGVANPVFVEVVLPAPVEVPAGTFFVGARWNPSVDQFFFLCSDSSPSTPPTNLWFIDDRSDEWDNTFTTTDPIFVNHRAALVRPVALEDATGIEGVAVPVGTNALALLAIVLAAAGLFRLWRA
jgi:hypothetical protein